MRKEPQVVYVVLYGHKHGEDVWVTSTEKKAHASIGAMVLQYIDDLEDEEAKKRIKRLIAKGEYLKASNIWFEKMEEWFEVHQRTVDT